MRCPVFCCPAPTSVADEQEPDQLEHRGRGRGHVGEGCRVEDLLRALLFLGRDQAQAVQLDHGPLARVEFHRERDELEHHSEGEEEDADVEQADAEEIDPVREMKPAMMKIHARLVPMFARGKIAVRSWSAA